ncbi:hypothetical protein [Pollutibacter soli]|uniref:hypothetical protein n=1 Tax=Pollutibacter soli TaxID=3034157 RepID=UPI003013D73F
MHQQRSFFERHLHWIIIIASVIIFTPFVCKYREIFPGKAVSHHTNWAEFATFFSLPISVINAIAVFYLGYKVYLAQKRRDEWERTQSLADLKFVAELGQVYKLYNMGNSVANHVIVAKVPSGTNEGTTNNTTTISRIHRCYSIPAGGHLSLLFTEQTEKLYARYHNGERFVLLTCVFDENHEISDSVIENFIVANSTRTNEIILRT